MINLNDPEVYAWVVLPILIFFARVTDVTLGTLRIIFISRGKRNVAPVLGFFEVLIWIVAIGQIVQNLTSVTSYLAYAAGFATGNFVGMVIEDRLAIGTLIVRVILPTNATTLHAQTDRGRLWRDQRRRRRGQRQGGAALYRHQAHRLS